MSGSVVDSDACGTDWEKWIDSTNKNDFIWKPQWKNFRIKICSQDKVLENPSGYLVPIKMQFLMTHHFSTVQKIIRNLDISTVESINSTEELLEIKLKSVEDEDILTEIERALARETDKIVMKPIQRLKFTSSLVEELSEQKLNEKSITLMRDETNIFIVGFEKMKSFISKITDEIHRVTAKKVVKLGDKWKTEAVKCFGIAETISRTFTDVVVRLQEDNSSVYLKGRDITINKAEKEVHKLLSDLFRETVHFDPLTLKLLKCQEASKLFKEILQKEHLQVVWTVDSTHLYLFSKTKINTDAIKAVVYGNFLTAGFSKSTPPGNQFCKSDAFSGMIKNHNNKLIFLETTEASVNIAGTKNLMLHLFHQEKLFYNDIEAAKCDEQKIMLVANDNCLMRPYDNPHDLMQSESQPKYNVIYPCETMPMPGLSFQHHPEGHQGQPYEPCLAPGLGSGYPYHYPHQSPRYVGHQSQLDLKESTSRPDLQKPLYHPDLQRPPSHIDIERLPYKYERESQPQYNMIYPSETMPMPGPSFHPEGHQCPPYGPYLAPGLGSGYPYDNPHQPPQYVGHQSQLDLQEPTSIPYLQRPLSNPDMKRQPDEHEMNFTLTEASQQSIKMIKVNNTLTDNVEEIEQSIKMIKVSNIPPGSSEDSIRFFFENNRKSGGGDIEDLDYDKDSHSVIITFEEEDVAERVLSRMPLLFEKNRIDVEIFIPRPRTPDVKEDGQAAGNEDTGDMPTDPKAANAEIVKMEFIEEKNLYMIWFAEESAIEAVMSKRLRVNGQTLNAKRYVPSPPPKYVPKYKDKVFITNISPTTTKDGLENFLEAKSKGIPEEIIFGEAEGTALVTFEQPPDTIYKRYLVLKLLLKTDSTYERHMEVIVLLKSYYRYGKLQTACMKRPLDGSHLSIHLVPITDCIVVTGYKDNTSSDTIKYYFDNKRLSGVEGVREVKSVQDEGKFLVYFTDPDSALQACNGQHKLEGQILKVQLYYECLDQDA
ncbi:unnamed protein product [Mytilus coruscus]|uniref:RRM domain-containing protein n=1 Tax=Mytilus coruscus TaxID=42192 RepID=A0A6J8D7K1_MYTCO|nr:unnamed protein product [Mytilus coruscus]